MKHYSSRSKPVFEVFEYVIRDADLGFLTSVAVRFIVSNAFAPHFSLFNLMYAALSSNLIVFDLTQSEYKRTIKRAKIAHLFLQSVSDHFHIIICLPM